MFGHLSGGEEGKSRIHVRVNKLKLLIFVVMKPFYELKTCGGGGGGPAHSLPPHRSLRAARGRAEDHSPPPDDHTQSTKMKTCIWDRFSPQLAGEYRKPDTSLTRAVQCQFTNSHLISVKSMGLSRNTKFLEPVHLFRQSTADTWTVKR